MASKAAIDPSLFSRVRKIQIKTSRMVTEIFSGEYRSVFKGRGMEFEEVREYQPGDEIRTIDWNVTARMGRPFVKVFTEERELTVFFIVDVSSSMDFGSRQRTKRDLATELCAVLAFTAIQNKDKVGVIFFSDHIEKYIPPGKGNRHVLRVIRELLTIGRERKTQSRSTQMQEALDYFNKVQRKKSVCFLISDFFCMDYEKVLGISTRKHDLVAVKVEDPLEKSLPKSGICVMEDLENQKQIWVDFSHPESLEKFKTGAEALEREWLQMMRKKGIDVLTVRTGEDYLKTLTRFFKKRGMHRG